MKFSILKKDIDTEARIGKISTHHGEFETPIFMPVATSAAIKGIHNKDLKESISPDVILSNIIAIKAITIPATKLPPNSAFLKYTKTSQPMSAVPPIIDAIITMLSEAIVV